MTALVNRLSVPILHDSPSTWLTALGVAALLYFVPAAVRALVRRRRERMLATERIELMEMPLEVLSHTTTLFMIVVSLLIGLQVLPVSGRARQALEPSPSS